MRELEGLYVPWQAAPAPEPRLLVLNEALAARARRSTPRRSRAEGVDVLAGNAVPEGATPVAQAYAGHQFGGYSPRLGDGRALLLGELVDATGDRRDLHLKGSGRTPFARGGDGKAAVGPMLREYVIGEAMHALGIPTTRALAVVATGEDVVRETLLPGAVLARVAASHMRVGTFQYAAAHRRPDARAAARRLRDRPPPPGRPPRRRTRTSRSTSASIEAQAALVAHWMLVGFIHGVMNTDNMTISGETIDYGPCAFMDAFDPATVFSSIDHGGRYAYGNQPHVAQWNLARLAEALLPLLDDDERRGGRGGHRGAADVPRALPPPLERRHAGQARAGRGRRATARWSTTCSRCCTSSAVDYTSAFRALSASLRGDAVAGRRSRVGGALARAARPRGRGPREVADGDGPGQPRLHPAQPPGRGGARRGHRRRPRAVHRLVDVVARPFDERPGLEAYAAPAPPSSGRTDVLRT